MKSVIVKAVSKKLKAILSFPGDKSLSHRAIIFGSLAEGKSCFTNVLSGEDCVCTREAFEAMGVKISGKSSTEINVEGKGLKNLRAPKKELYLGNSGTSMRLLLGILSACPFESILTGDPSLSSRPMRRVTDFLRQMGASFEGRDNANFAPIKVKGSKLRAIHAKLPVSSAQVKSAILLAGLYADGETKVTEPVKSRDHTERFLKFFGAKISEKKNTVALKGAQKLKARSFEIAGDISSAAFFMAIAVLLKSKQIKFKNVLWNPTRTGIVQVLKRMGVKFRNQKIKTKGPEPLCDFSLEASKLKAFEIKREELPSLIDEIPILMVLATQASGTSIIHEADELRVKETDRIHSMSTNLLKMGAKIKVKGNTIYVDGPTPLHGAEIESFKDHRTAMAHIVAGMLAAGQTRVRDVDCINTSFPNFFKLLGKLRIPYQIVDTP